MIMQRQIHLKSEACRHKRFPVGEKTPSLRCKAVRGTRFKLPSVMGKLRMVDLSDGMKSFQQALRRGKIAIHVAMTDPNLFVHLDWVCGAQDVSTSRTGQRDC